MRSTRPPVTPVTAGQAARPTGRLARLVLLGTALSIGVTLLEVPPGKAALPDVALTRLAAVRGPEQLDRGDASGRPHEVRGTRSNRYVPPSSKARYPTPVRHRWRNRGWVVDGSPTSRRTRPDTGFRQGESREVTSRRTATTTTYSNPDGTQTTAISATPVRYRGPDGAWLPIDPAFRPGPDGSLASSGGALPVSLPAARPGGPLATVDLGQGRSLSWRLAGGRVVTPRMDDDVATYIGLLRETDLEIQAQAGAVKETIVLGSRRAPRVFDVRLDLRGVRTSLDRGDVVLTAADGTAAGRIPAGWMSDAAGATSTAVRYSLPEPDLLRISVDRAWLADPARAYPVRVDPTVLTPRTFKNATAMTVNNGGAYNGASDFETGGGARNRTYLKWDLSAIADHKVFGANLSVVNYLADSCYPDEVAVREVTDAWSLNPSAYSMANAPALGRTLDSSRFGYGFVELGATASKCRPQGSLFELGVRGRDLVQGWVDGGVNKGLALTAPHGGYKKYAGPSTVNGPLLYVTHSAYDAGYRIKNPTPSPIVMQNQDGKVTVSVTNKSASGWAAGDYSLRYRVFDAKGKLYSGLPEYNAVPSMPAVARDATKNVVANLRQMPAGMYYLDFSVVKNKAGAPAVADVWFTDQQVAPVRMALRIYDVPPVVSQMYPQNGYSAPSLQPQLFAKAIDVDATPNSTTYSFKVCTNQGMTTGCFTSGTATTSKGWVVPAGKLTWSKQYWWNFTSASTTSPTLTFFTDAPQPTLTAHLAGADYSAQERDVDPSVGNYSTSAIDAAVPTVGPDLAVARTYNSLDPRADGAFGAGWSTKFDVRAWGASNSSIVRMPTGQEVRFGRNADGTWTAPRGRDLTLVLSGSTFVLSDRGGSTWTFDALGRLASLKESTGRPQTFTYDAGGRLDTVTSGNSRRGLAFDWTGERVSSVSTLDADGATVSTWTYQYDGAALTRVCPPTGPCTTYEYADGSHYRSAVLDSKPDSYWRLGDGGDPGVSNRAESEVEVNLGKDVAGAEATVVHGTAGAIAHTTDTAITVNGNAAVRLANGAAKKSRDMTVEVWFKAAPSTTAMPVAGYQNKVYNAATAPTTGVPLLYVGTDGKLRGQFADGTFTPVTSTTTVTNSVWHHAVLTSVGATTTLYVDGVRQGAKTSTINHAAYTYNQVGAAYATTPGSWPAYGTTALRYFKGSLDEVAVYSHGLSADEVKDHFVASVGARQLARVVLPSGKVAAEVTYDTETDRVAEYTDANGGTWKLGVPVVAGDADDIRRTVTMADPADRIYLYEYDALAGYLLRSASPNGQSVRPEDTQFCEPPTTQDPRFCAPPPAGTTLPMVWNLAGSDVRSMEYDDQGRLVKIYNEIGNVVSMKYDARGNVTERTTCRGWSNGTPTGCATEYTKYPDATSGYGALDPRWDQPVETRDARSSSATDNRYRTTYAYTPSGKLDLQVGPAPVSARVDNTFSAGSESAVGGGTVPPGLPLSSIDDKGATTAFDYYSSGDIATITEPGGLVTRYTYDRLGHTATRTEEFDGKRSTTTYEYDALGRLTRTLSPQTRDVVSDTTHQQQVVQTYDADGNVLTTEVSDALGHDEPRVTSYEYDDHNRMVVSTDPLDESVTYEYDQFGNQVSMVDPNGTRTEFAYTPKNKLAEVRLRDPDDAGRDGFLITASYAYDAAGRTVATWDGMGRKVAIDYFADDLVAKKTITTFRRPGSTQDTSYVLEEMRYDAAGNVIEEKSGNGTQTVTYVRDEYGRVKTRTVGTAPLTRTETYTYDDVGNVTQVDSSGDRSNVPWATTDSSSVRYAYDGAGRVTSESTVLPSGTATTTTEYDGRGNVVRVVPPRGNVAGADEALRSRYATTYAYDEVGRPVRTTLPATLQEQYGETARTGAAVYETGYNTFGEQVATRDPLGRVARGTYDKRGQLVSQSDPAYTAPGAVSAVTPTTSYAYDANGNRTEITDPRGAVTRLDYDKWGRVVQVDAPASTNKERAVTRYSYTRSGQLSRADSPAGRTEQTYDDLDRMITSTVLETVPTGSALTTSYTYDDASNLTRVVSPLQNATVSTYDALGQLTAVRDPAGTSSGFGYDGAGRQVKVTDGLGRSTRTDYDVAGRRVADIDLSSAGVEGATQRYTYDVAGNLVQATPSGARATTYEYDALDRRTTQVEPVSADVSITTTFGYDAVGNRSRYTDGRGNATWYSYSTLGLESVVEPATYAQPAVADRRWQTTYDAGGLPVTLSSPGGVTRTRTYDTAGRLTQETGSGAEASTATRDLTYDLAGRLRTLSTPAGSDTYDYNQRGQVVSASGPSGTATMTYDADGNLTRRTDASGTSDFGYVSGRLSAIDDGASGVRMTLGYDASGATSSIDYGAGRVRTFGYDAFGRPASDVLTNGSAQTVMSAAYEYDGRNRVARKRTTGVPGAGDHTYSYDQAARLTSWTVAGGATTTYGWDASSNRTKVDGTTATFDERNRLINDGTTDYSWSPRGTLRSRTTGTTTESLTFDAFDRMVSQGSRTYRYDAADRMFDAGGGAPFAYAGLDDDVVDDGSAVYGRGPGGGLLSERASGRTRLLLADQHGDVVGGFDPADTTLSTLPDARSYDPWGQQTGQRGAQPAVGFQGSWTDPATGDVNMKARWYDTTTGSFASRDSVDYRSGPSALANKYLYGAADPVTRNDPDGHWPSCGWCGDVADSVSSAVTTVASGVSHAASTAYHYASSAASKVYEYGKAAVRAVADAGRWLYDKARAGLSYLGDKISDAYNYAADAILDGIDWARQKAEEAARAAHRAAVAVTEKTKSAIEHAAKYNPIPAIAKAVAPVFAGVKDVVSAVANAPARIVQATVDVVQATAKQVQQAYEKTVQSVGNVVQSVSTAVTKVGEFVKDNWKTIASVAAGIVVGAACTAVTAGAGTAACALLGTAVSGALDGALSCPPGRSMASCAGKGAVDAVIAPVTDTVGCLTDPTVAGCVAAAMSVVPGAAGHAAGKYFSKLKKLDGTCNCFAAGTEVRTAEGRKPIEKVEVGDRVWAKDMVTGKNRLRRVTSVASHVDTRMMTLKVAGERVRVTTEHPFHTPDRGWVTSGDLRVGDRVTQMDGGTAVVAEVRRDATPTRVFNFAVEGDHNYSVTEADLLVHNAACDLPGAAGAETARGGVYSLRDEAGSVVRTGRTKDLPGREVAHANDPVLGDYQFNVEYRTDVYPEQRGLEQMLYDAHPGAQAANGGFNKIRGISPFNPKRALYMQSARDFLGRLGLG